MTKVVHVLGGLVAGGAENLVVDFLIALRRRNYDTYLYVYSSHLNLYGKGQLNKLNECGIHVIFGPTKTLSISTIFAFTKFLLKIRPSIIHYHLPKHDYLRLFSRLFLKAKSFRTAHNTKITYFEVILLRTCKYERIVACSVAVQQILASYGVESELIVNAVNYRYDHKKVKLNELSSLRFCSVGRMDSNSISELQKGFDLLISAWKRTRLGESGCDLDIFGSGNRKSDLIQLASSDKSINFKGVSDNIQLELLNYDVFILASRHEGLPLSALEAIGTGLFCIFSDIPELLHLTTNCIYFKSESVESLQSALEYIKGAKDPLLNYEEILIIRNKFSHDVMIDKYEKLYKTVVFTHNPICV